MIGAGGVGAAAAAVAQRREAFERVVLADVEESRAAAAAARTGDPRFGSAPLDASDPAAIAALALAERADAILNAVDPRFNPAIFAAAFDAGCTYLDLAMTLSDPERGLKLGDQQFAQAARWEEQGRLALVGIGVEPGLSDVFARYAADELFGEIDLIGVRDGANLVVSSSSPTAAGRARACSGPRRSRPLPSSSSSPTTVHRTGSWIGRFWA